MPDQQLFQRAEDVVDQVVTAVIDDAAPAVQVEAPPGAGKTRLVRRVLSRACAAELSTLAAAQTNAQAIDLALGLAADLEGSELVFGVWPSGAAKAEWKAELDLLRAHPNAIVCETTSEANTGPAVTIAVARKWAWHACDRRNPLQRRFELGIVDEAYQMRAGELLRFGAHVERLLLVGDPGQLDPFTELEAGRWAGLEASALTPAPRAVQASWSGAPRVFGLPATLRLDARAAVVVQDCFYPQLPFAAVTQAGERELILRAARGRRRSAGVRAVDATLERAARTGWGLLELRRAATVRDDPQVADAIGTLAERLVQRSPVVRGPWPASLRAGAPLEVANVAVAVAHRDQRDRVRERLAASLPEVVVDTANRLQGREFDVTIVWHPLTGRVDATEFHLDVGRLCVMTSRHRQACVVVGRAGLGELLDEYLPSSLRPRGAREDREHDGWLAHQRFLRYVGDSRVQVGAV